MKPMFRPPESWPRAYNTQDVAFLRKKKSVHEQGTRHQFPMGETFPWRYYKAQLVHFISCSLKDFCGATVVLFRCRKFIQWDRSILTRQLVVLPSIISQIQDPSISPYLTVRSPAAVILPDQYPAQHSAYMFLYVHGENLDIQTWNSGYRLGMRYSEGAVFYIIFSTLVYFGSF